MRADVQKNSKPLYLAWGLGSLGTIAAISSVSNFYLFFLSTVLGMSPVLAGTLIFGSKMFDVVTDPLMGYVSDRTKSRSGRRRPWLLWSSPLVGASIGLLFSVGEFGISGSALTAVVLGLLLLHALVLTMFNVPYLAMPAEMTDDYHERSTLMSYRALFLVGGGFAGNAIAGLIVKNLGSDSAAYAVMGWTVGTLTFLAMILCWLGTARARTTAYEATKIPAADQFKLLFVNRPFLVLALLKSLQFLQLASGGATMLFFFVTVMGRDESALFPYGVGIVFATLLCLPLWLKVGRRLGKRTAFAVSLCAYMLVHLSWLPASPDEPTFFIVLRAVFGGTFVGGILIFGQSMIVDVIAYDRKISGINREGLFSSVFSFFEKITYAAGPLLIGILLSSFGFDPTVPRGQPQPEGAATAIYMGVIWIPILCNLAMLCCLAAFRLDEKTLNEAELHVLARTANNKGDT
jgi:glycoside/pentoside/hexuronide:cation symporter, GPH family